MQPWVAFALRIHQFARPQPPNDIEIGERASDREARGQEVVFLYQVTKTKGLSSLRPQCSNPHVPKQVNRFIEAY